MGGFLPLIEGFLAFVLTMLALTTGVSAVVGAIQRLRRRRARGLRDMVRLLYLREILPLRDKPSQNSELGSLERRRVDFIADMTLMPLPVVVDQLEMESGESYWLKKIESSERLAGAKWYWNLEHPIRLFRRWTTLRYGLDALTDGEFKTRLAESAEGKSLKESKAWQKRRLQSWEELTVALLRSFQTIGAAASETFARQSRGMSFVVGFFLAIGINVDSIDLLNSYLTDPALRASVLARSEQILGQESTGSNHAQPSSTPQLDASAIDQVSEAAEELIATASALSAALGNEGGSIVQDLNDRAQAVREQLSEVRGDVNDMNDELSTARREILGVTRSLTSSFPIGWNRFPNCTTESSDLRCVGFGNVEEQGDGDTRSFSRWAVLEAVQSRRPAEFSKWVAGVLLTGLLLGLGTPFWVQLVTRLMNLRRWTANGEDSGRGAALR